MKFLILSCNTGGGHNAAGFAMKQRLEAEGHEAVLFDYLTLAGKGVSRIVGDGYVQIVKTAPHFFGLAYSLGMLVSRTMKRSPVYYANSRMAKYLEQYLTENQFDAIIMPHLYPAETITYMKQKGMKVPKTFFISTDYTCIPFSEETNCDYYIIPHRDLRDQYINRGVDPKKLVPIGIPVRMEFGAACSKESARTQLGLDPEKNLLLVIGGSMGAGHVGKLTDYIWQMCKKQDQMIIICGSNQKIYKKLARKYSEIEAVQVIGQTDRMDLYMHACDVVYTKPGGLSSTEAAVAGVPLVHTTPIPGCETANRRFFAKRKMSVSARTDLGQAETGIRLLHSEALQQKMIQAQHQEIDVNTSLKIYQFILKSL